MSIGSIKAKQIKEQKNLKKAKNRHGRKDKHPQGWKQSKNREMICSHTIVPAHTGGCVSSTPST